MTDAQFAAWLKNSAAIRCVLLEVNVQVGGVETTRFLSNKGYVTKPTDTPASVVYSPYITGGVQFTETLSIDGNSASLSFGDIELDNLSGDRDSWLDDIWANRSIKVFIGDVSWPRADFRQIFDGIVVGIDSKSRSKINLKLGDKMQRLNNPIIEDLLGGSTANKDRYIPVCFGEVHNVSPLLVDPTTNVYQVHNGPIEDIIEVRDNGVPVAFTKSLATGRFTLSAQPAGTVTASVQGDKPSTYSNDVASLIQELVTRYGKASKLTVADIDTAAFAAFKTLCPQAVGCYFSDRTNLVDAINQLASSVGARVYFNRAGKLTIKRIELPRPDAGTTVQPKDITQHSLSVSSLPAVQAGVQLGYCKNFTVQSNIQTGIPSTAIDLYEQEWLTATATDSSVQATYKTFTTPTMQQTLLCVAADAYAEAQRRLNIFKVQRKVLKYVGQPHLMLEQLGDSQTLVNRRFGLENGKTGQIVSVQTDWLNPHATIEVLI